MYVYCMYYIVTYSMLITALDITNGPMDTIVRTGNIANISCGFINADPEIVPSWMIIKRSNDGSVISSMIISPVDIITDDNDGLEWVDDTTSGANMSPNSRLLVGPVNQTYNHSSYQCIFTRGRNIIESSIGTLIVAGEFMYYRLTYVGRYVYIYIYIYIYIYHIVSSYGRSGVKAWS